MLCRSADDIPPPPGLVYEPKWDGFRCIVFRDGDTLHLESSQQPAPAALLPRADSTRCAQRLPEQAVVDGEIVIAGPRGLDFDALPAPPPPCGVAGANARRGEPGDLHRL